MYDPSGLEVSDGYTYNGYIVEYLSGPQWSLNYKEWISFDRNNFKTSEDLKEEQLKLKEENIWLLKNAFNSTQIASSDLQMIIKSFQNTEQAKETKYNEYQLQLKRNYEQYKDWLAMKSSKTIKDNSSQDEATSKENSALDSYSFDKTCF